MRNELMRCDALNRKGRRCGHEGTEYKDGVWVCSTHGSKAEKFRVLAQKMRARQAPMTDEQRARISERRRQETEAKLSALLATGEKACSTCGKVKPLSEYHATTYKYGNHGVRGECKLCRKKKRMLWDMRRQRYGPVQTPAARGRAEQARRDLRLAEERGVRTCAMCREVLPLDRFAVRHSEAGGTAYQSYCRECHRMYKRRRKEAA